MRSKSPSKPSGGANQNVHNDLPLFTCAKEQHPIKILRLPEVIARVGLKRASIYRYISEKQFPKSVRIGVRAVGWLEHEIDGWLQRCWTARDDMLER